MLELVGGVWGTWVTAPGARGLGSAWAVALRELGRCQCRAAVVSRGAGVRRQGRVGGNAGVCGALTYLAGELSTGVRKG
jgi:hypothetical protein